MTPIFKLIAQIIFLTLLIIYVGSFFACTTASIETSDGTKIKYTDMHPTGSTHDINVEWKGVGSLESKRSSEGAEKVIEAVDLESLVGL